MFFKSKFNFQKSIFIQVPVVDETRCMNCGRCVQVCQFGAIKYEKKKLVISEELCHGCGSCKINCPGWAISEKGREIGVLKTAKVDNINFIQGILKNGSSLAGPLIKEVKKSASKKGADIDLLLCAPGASRAVISALKAVDFVVLIAENNKANLEQTKEAVVLLRKLNIPFFIFLNRFNGEEKLFSNWAKSEDIDIISKLPNDMEIAKIYAKEDILLEKLPEYKKYFEPLLAVAKVGEKWLKN